MAKVFWVGRQDTFFSTPSSTPGSTPTDLFIRCDNGGLLRISLWHDGIGILVCSDVKQEVYTERGYAGFMFCVREEKFDMVKPASQHYPYSIPCPCCGKDDFKGAEEYPSCTGMDQEPEPVRRLAGNHGIRLSP